MQVYIIRRLLLIIPTIFLVTAIVFLLVRFIPGDVLDLIAVEIAAEGHDVPDIEETLLEIRHTLGLDVAIHVQYARWLGVWPQQDGNFSGAFQGDLGDSLWTSEPVTWELISRIPVSLELGILAMIIGLLYAIPIGIYSSIRQDTLGDYGGRTVAILAISVPNFWVATMVIVYPSIYLGWSPPLDYIPPGENLIGNLGQFLLPATILGTFYAGTIMRMTRTMMLEVLRQDYIRTAWAKGLNERAVVIRHSLKNAMIPVTTIVGLQVATVIGGSVVIEQIFALPGVGRYLISAVTNRDYPVIAAINLVVSVSVVFVNLAVDLAYGWLDPRVHYK